MAAKSPAYIPAPFGMVFFLVLFLLPAMAFAETDAAAQPSAGEDDTAPGYRHESDANGNPVYTQNLAWDEDENALMFEIVIRDPEGSEILRKETGENRLELTLTPGDYTYNIITWNLLGQRENESGLLPITVIKAEIPNITLVSPTFLFMDSLDTDITLQGEKIIPTARFFLVNGSGAKTEGKEIGRTDESEISVAFPDRAYQPGTFDIEVVNPGGLSDTEENAVRILFQRPVDILFSIGYSPVVFLHDAWFKENWPEPVYWPGMTGSLSVYFLKKSWGFLGIEATASAHRLTGGLEQASLTSDYLLYGGRIDYKYRFTRAFHGIVRAGGGIAYGYHRFDYGGMPGPETGSSNVYVESGLAAQYFLPRRTFVELGSDLIYFVEGTHSVVGIRPSLKFGYRIF